MGRCIFLRICNSIFASGSFPSGWRKYLITFISKIDGQKFRPISFASCLCKIMERILSNRLNWWLESENKLLVSQFGFRRELSCTNNLAILYVENLRSFQMDIPMAAAFLDQSSI